MLRTSKGAGAATIRGATESQLTPGLYALAPSRATPATQARHQRALSRTFGKAAGNGLSLTVPNDTRLYDWTVSQAQESATNLPSPRLLRKQLNRPSSQVCLTCGVFQLGFDSAHLTITE